ncbi:MAG TPA: N-acetylmuramoyl-L-alanine amidase [Actinoplanes sp.]|nr:N-acetylmuramoyl-L-alanine amidase [Actinoplanes sp.]
MTPVAGGAAPPPKAGAAAPPPQAGAAAPPPKAAAAAPPPKAGSPTGRSPGARGTAGAELSAPASVRADLNAPGTARAEAAAGAPAVTERRTQPFSLLGVTWTDPRARLAGTIEVRTRSVATGRWSGWQPLESDGTSPADPGSVDGAGRGRTDPLWVGTSDGVRARVAADGGTRPLPRGLRLDLINPDEPQAKAGAAAPPPKAGSAPAGRLARVAVPARPVPKMITRAGWGANEAIVRKQPEYTTDVQVVFVHHTAGPNGYSCADSARIVRGIELYHVRGNNWNDIGYNFLVDRCGNLFEGRKGGVNRAVLGAHTLGFNAHSSAIAVLGDYRARAVPARVKTVIAQVAAYKLGAYGNLATGRTMLMSGGSDRYAQGRLAALNRVSGHRDTGRTECPGDVLYGQLGSIRSIAGAGPAGLRLLRMTGAVAAGAAYYTRGPVSPLWSTTTPSALLNRFDVLVDGRLARSARNSHRKGTIRLPAGRHTVTVRAIHLSGRTASFTRTVIVDATAPRFTTGPSLTLRTGSLNGTVPVRLGWTAADVGGLRSVALTRPRPVNLGVTATGRPGFARPGVPTTWTLRATDRAGNARDASVTRTPVVVSEAAAARTGSWATRRHAAYLSGGALHSSTPGSSLTWTFTGRSAGLAVSRTATSGKITVYLDGSRAGTLDLRSRSRSHRQAVWAKNWGVTGRHTVKVVVSGAAVLDGLVVLG